MRYSVHKCLFANWNASSILTISISNSNSYLALSREDGSIEIWNIEHFWFLELIIPGQGSDFAARSLVWVPYFDENNKQTDQKLERLFSAGLSGEIIEWNLSKLIPKETTIVGAGGIWQMKSIISIFTNETDDKVLQCRLCLGCEDGRVRIYSISDSGSCVLRATSLRQPTRILSVTWSNDAKFVAAGDSNGDIRIFQSESCKQKYRMKTKSTEDNPSRIWAVSFLKDGTLVSGNSRGETEFWDSKIGVQIQSIKTHDHDITSISTTNDENTIAVSGIDCRVARLNKLPDRWATERSRRYHTHDVNAACIIAKEEYELVVSGGIDTLLLCQALHEGLEKSKIRYLYPFPHFPIFSTCIQQKTILVHSETNLHLWEMGMYQNEEMNQGYIENFSEIPIEEPAKHKIQIDIKSEKSIYCSSISANGKYIAASDTNTLVVFSLSRNNNNYSLKKCSIPGVPVYGVIRICFSPQHIILAYNNGLIIVFNLFSKEISKIFNNHQCDNHGSIHTLDVSDDGQWLASSDTKNNIHVYNLDVMKHYIKLPVFPYPVTAIKFSPVEAVLTIACSNLFIYQYDVESKDLTNWSKRYSDDLPSYYLNKISVITNITFNPSNPSICFLISALFICKIDFTLPIFKGPIPNSGVKRNRDGSEIPLKQKALPKNFALINNYQPVLYGSFIEANGLVLIQKPRSHLIQGLPEPVHKTRPFLP